MASVGAIAATGLGWSGVREIGSGMSTSDALAAAPGTRSSDGTENILLMGLDTRKDQDGNDLPPQILDQLHAGDGEEGGYNTNTLILLHIPSDHSQVTAFSIPRDDYVAVKDIPGNDHVKIKEAYGLKKAATEQSLIASGVKDPATLEHAGREAGRRETLQTVRDFVGVPIDRFAEVTLAGFYDLATALDGVQVCLNSAVHDDYSGANFPAGVQRLSGSQALAFVRQRHGLTNGDLDRTHRQQAFLASVWQQVRSAGTLTDMGKMQSLMSVAKKDVVISSGWDVAAFAQQAQDLNGNKVTFKTLPILRYDQIDGQDVNIVDATAVRSEVRTAFGITEMATQTPIAPTSVVDVLNGTGTEGLAATVSAQLGKAGFKQGDIGNTTFTESAVTYGAGAESDADNAAHTLGDLSVSSDPSLAPGRVRVVLGQGFDDPAQTGPAAVGDTTAAQPPTAAPTPVVGPEGDAVKGGGVPCVD